MITGTLNTDSVKTTSYKVVLPFYIYAAISFLTATLLLFIFSDSFTQHYFHPKILAITHIMALGWGTMIILGASHQLVPVLIEGKLYSNALAYTSFFLSAIGIPLLVYGFYVFDMGEIARWGGRFVLLSITAYLINLGISISKSKSDNIHAVYVFTSVLWLFITVFLGLVLVYNFTTHLLNQNSLHYLPLHVHAGVVGWFLLLVIGVGSRLIPMFMISKYTNTKILKWIFFLINAALISYIFLFYFSESTMAILFPLLLLFMGIALFIFYCFSAYKQRIRKQVDNPMKISLLSVFMMIIPLLLILAIIIIVKISSDNPTPFSLSYGFLILFGWVTAIILGMTFKTLPFIVWNKVYHNQSEIRKGPNPKDLFSDIIFVVMSITYLIGLVLFTLGSLLSYLVILKTGSAFLLISAALYFFNVMKVIIHKPQLA